MKSPRWELLAGLKHNPSNLILIKVLCEIQTIEVTFFPFLLPKGCPAKERNRKIWHNILLCFTEGYGSKPDDSFGNRVP